MSSEPQGDDMPTGPRFSFRCIEVRQPVGVFYVAAMPADDLVDISWADIRNIEDSALDTYLGIQRRLSPERVKELTDYVRTVDASFPTSIIVAVRGEDAQFDETRAVMSLPKHQSVAKIIDGQHRVAGLKTLRGSTFMVNVTIFVDMDIADQANVFATINLAQTKVSKSLVYDLYAYAKTRSPQKACHNIARLLNREEQSPLHWRIKILGRATPGRSDETLTQAAVVESLLPYLSDEPEKERDMLKRGLKLAPTPFERKRALIFRELFRLEKEEDIALNVWNCFVAVSQRWPDAWNAVERGNIINRTTGFLALMRFLRPAYLAYGKENEVAPVSHFKTLLDKVQLDDRAFTSETYKPGGAGVSALARELIRGAGIEQG